jgi:predicted dehydrogenase
VRRILPRLRGGTVTAIVDANLARGKRTATDLGLATWAASTQELHEKHGDAFDAWAAAIPRGWLIAAHDNRPLDPRPEAWDDLPAGWVWGHAHRFLPSVRTIKESLNSGKLGAPGLVRIHHWLPHGSGDALPASLPLIDIACWLVDQRPTVVFAQSGTERRYVQVHLGFDDDRMALLDCTTGLPEGNGYDSLSVIASTGAAYADDHHNRQLVFKGGRTDAVSTREDELVLLAILQEFIDATKAGRPPSCGAAEWKRARSLQTAVEQSLSAGQSVALGGAA